MKEKRYLSEGELNVIRFEEDMLKGNINRMCVSDDSEELMNMYAHAINRLKRIYNICWGKYLHETESED